MEDGVADSMTKSRVGNSNRVSKSMVGNRVSDGNWVSNGMVGNRMSNQSWVSNGMSNRVCCNNSWSILRNSTIGDILNNSISIVDIVDSLDSAVGKSNSVASGG